MPRDTEPVSAGLTLLRPTVPRRHFTPGTKYRAADTRFPVVPVCDPKGRILFVAITANSANSNMIQFTREGRPAIHPDFPGWSLLADLYDQEPDKHRREAGAKFVEDYIRAWKLHPSGENRAGKVQWNPPFDASDADRSTPVDHLLPQEVLDRRSGKSKPTGGDLEIPPPKKAG